LENIREEQVAKKEADLIPKKFEDLDANQKKMLQSYVC
jgi:hypothetical protein